MLMILQDKGKTICLISDEDKKPKENSKTNEDQFFSVENTFKILLYFSLEKRFNRRLKAK